MASLSCLPRELIDSITGHLPNGDLKSLRLASAIFGRRVLLRIYRVFISANPLNVKVFREIADSETYRHRVVEIVWDDARLETPPKPPPAWCRKHDRDMIIYTYMEWFKNHCSRNRGDDKTYDGGEWQDQLHIVSRKQWIAAEPPVEDMYKHYIGLLVEQSKTMASDDDVEAFEYGLQQFTALNKITLTPATHGIPFTPLYKTPMIRSFPYGFNYPISRGWLASEPAGRLDLPKWDQLEKRNRWRGYRIITWMLARRDHNIKEFIVDVCLLNTGLNSHMFDESCDDADNLLVLLTSPGFRRLDLSLIVGDGQFESGFPAFRSRTLRSAFEQATDLQHFSLRTNIEYETGAEDWAMEGDDGFVPLKTVFPVECWTKLRYFGLSSFIVRLDDLVDFLASLPETVLEVDLSFLLFQKGHGSHRELLTAMKSQLCWCQRREDQRPTVRMGWHRERMVTPDGQAIWLDKEVNDYLYNDGENPFAARGDGVYNCGFTRDIFQPAHNCPNLSLGKLMRAGYIRPDKSVWPEVFTVDGTFVPPEGWQRAVDRWVG